MTGFFSSFMNHSCVGWSSGSPGHEDVLERGQVVFVHVCRILLLQDAGGGRGREHDVDLVLLDDLPPDARIGRSGVPSYITVAMPAISGP